MLAEPVRNDPRQLSRARERDPTIGQGVSKGGIAHPNLGEGAQVGVEQHVDLESRIGQAQIHLVFVDDDPVVATLCRQ